MPPRTKDEVVARIAQGRPDFGPDARHQYGNAGYILLGQIVENVGGKAYRDARKGRITSKTGRNDTYYLDSGNTDAGRNESMSYRYLDGWKDAAELDFSVPGGAGSGCGGASRSNEAGWRRKSDGSLTARKRWRRRENASRARPRSERDSALSPHADGAGERRGHRHVHRPRQYRCCAQGLRPIRARL